MPRNLKIAIFLITIVLTYPLKAVADLAEVQKKVLSDAAQVVEKAEVMIEQRSAWIKKNKETELHFISTLKSFDEHTAAGTEAKTDEERVKWGPMKKLMNEILEDESNSRKRITAGECFMGGCGHRADIPRKKKDYPEIAEWLEEKAQFFKAVGMYLKTESPEEAGDILDAWDEYNTLISTYPEFSGFYIRYYAATKYITEGKVPENLKALLKREGLLEAAETQYQGMNERFGTISKARQKVQAQNTATVKNEEWRAQVLSQVVNVGSLTAKIVESKIDFMPMHYEAQQHFAWALKHIQVGEFPQQITVYPEGGFYMISLEVKNNGKQNVALNSQQFQLVDAKGRKFTIHEGAQSALKSIGKSLIKTVFADSITQGLLVFDVPKPIPQGLVLKMQAGGSDKSIYLSWRKPKGNKSAEKP